MGGLKMDGQCHVNGSVFEAIGLSKYLLKINPTRDASYILPGSEYMRTFHGLIRQRSSSLMMRFLYLELVGKILDTVSQSVAAPRHGCLVRIIKTDVPMMTHDPRADQTTCVPEADMATHAGITINCIQPVTAK
jgi:hypothetical protein